jgi:pimeloyl-ACP methyl ester carboxylesterase
MPALIDARDGRKLAVHEAGDSHGVAVIVHHGTPQSGLLYRNWASSALSAGIRLISYDRPGYGGSTRSPGRSVADCVADVEAIADALELERFATWGISGGGPHALACAALCDERLFAAASLAAIAPYDADGLDWLAGMGESNVEEFHAVLAGEAVLRPLLEQWADEFRRSRPSDLIELWSTLLGPADQGVLTAEFVEDLHESDLHGLEPGVDGWLDDDFAFAAAWGFDVSAIDRPVLLLQGADDRFVPLAHGQWLAARIPGVEARITGLEDGHLTLTANRVPEVHDWLLADT